MPKEVGGDQEWEWEYLEPVEGENRLLTDDAARGAIQDERFAIVHEYEEATFNWILAASTADGAGKAAEEKGRRKAIAERLRQNYWKLDPYVRARSYLDRKGVIGHQGEIHLSPSAQES
jgi:hypothetical protein